MEVLKFKDYNSSVLLAEDFIDNIRDLVNESDSNSDSYKKVLNKIVHDLKLKSALVLTLGAGLQAMFPIVNKLVSNMNLKIDITADTVVLMTVAGVTIAYLEEIRNQRDKRQYEADSRSMLEELKLRGIGNGIIKKIVICIKSIGNIFKIIFKNKRAIINGFFDMFGYTALALPTLNAILYMVNKYDMNIDTLPSNFLSIGIGVTTLVAKHGLNYIIDKLKSKLNINKDEIFKTIGDVKEIRYKKDKEISMSDSKTKLINEQ